MSPVQPTTWQRFVASGGWTRAWFAAVVIITVGGSLYAAGFPSGDRETLLYHALIALLAIPTGLVLAFFPGGILWASVLQRQGVANGGPYDRGDEVYIIAGPHAAMVARVYDHGQGESVRLDLGEEYAARFEDTFSCYELLRVSPRRPPADAKPVDSKEDDDWDQSEVNSGSLWPLAAIFLLVILLRGLHAQGLLGPH